MYTIIATPTCNKCKIAKKRLELAKVPHKYRLMSELNSEDQETVRFKAMDAGQMQFPIVLNEDRMVVDIEEVLTDARQNRKNS